MGDIIDIEKYKDDNSQCILFDLTEFYPESEGNQYRICPYEMFISWFRGEIIPDEVEPLMRYIVKEWFILELKAAGRLEEYKHVFDSFPRR